MLSLGVVWIFGHDKTHAQEGSEGGSGPTNVVGGSDHRIKVLRGAMRTIAGGGEKQKETRLSLAHASRFNRRLNSDNLHNLGLYLLFMIYFFASTFFSHKLMSTLLVVYAS